MAYRQTKLGVPCPVCSRMAGAEKITKEGEPLRLRCNGCGATLTVRDGKLVPVEQPAPEQSAFAALPLASPAVC